MNKVLKNLSSYGIIYITLIIVFLGLLTLSASLPQTRKFESLMRRSARILEKGGDYPEMAGVLLDNYTDALILDIAYSFDSEQPLHSAVELDFYEKPGKELAPILLDIVNGKKPDLKKSNYSRYWFGHSAIMKILHYVLHLDKIYNLYGVMILFLSFIVVLLAYKTAGSIGAFGFFILPALCNFQVFFQSLQYPPVFLIGLAGSILIYCQKDICRRRMIFFALGMLTAFFDLLTAPILAFGIPALLFCGKDYLQLDSSERQDWKNWFRIWLGYPAAWLAGYMLSWGTKILLVICCTDHFQDVISQAVMRIGTQQGMQKISRSGAVVMNFRTLFDNNQLIFSLIIVVSIVLLMVNIIKWKKHLMTFNSRLFCGYLILAVMPVAVFWLMANHTYIHCWMTYRGLALTFAALFMSFTAFQPKTENES